MDWKPVLRGKVYCSLACGGNCKLKDFENAAKKANALCKKLGKNFTPRIWENLGWHWEVKNANITIGSNYDDEFSANYSYGWRARGKTAKKALKNLLKNYLEEVEDLNEKIQEIEMIIGEMETECVSKK